jgi:hypothetical protein
MPGHVAHLDARGCAREYLAKLVRFYAKYHLLTGAGYRVLEHDLQEVCFGLQHSSVVLEHHVDVVRWRTEDVRGHFEAWIDDPYLMRNRWLRHPRLSFECLVAEGAQVLVGLRDELPRQCRFFPVMRACVTGAPPA